LAKLARDGRSSTLSPKVWNGKKQLERNLDKYLQQAGLYLSFSDKGNLASVIENWPHDVEITVVTDGSRILGLGDLGINGMGIPVGKLSLYTACAGINPLKTLPITLDEMMAALTERWPSIVIQFEDFKNPFPSLERYKDTYTMFNDDIQGTGAVILAGFINAVKQSGTPAKDQRAVFLGAGSAGVGVAKQLAAFFINEGLTEDEARKCFWLVDSKGMVTNDRDGELAEHKKYFSRDDNNGEQYKTLEEVVDYVKPTILMGLSTIGGAFTPEILKKMAKMNDRPVVFPLSNPSSKSECTFEDAIKYTNGKCLFASGSPFPTLDFEGQKLVPGQGNNMCKSSNSPQMKLGWFWLCESWCQYLASRLHSTTQRYNMHTQSLQPYSLLFKTIN
jgi:malate dehydrogenase (oxaloacetate-decarboxylating)(NADP+)